MIDWMSLIVAKVSPWIQLDSENKMIRTNSEKVIVNHSSQDSITINVLMSNNITVSFQAFEEECSLAQHLNVPVVMTSLRNGRCVNLARCLQGSGKARGNQSVCDYCGYNISYNRICDYYFCLSYV